MPSESNSTNPEESPDESTDKLPAESTNNSSTESTTWPTFERRPLLKALGAGAALSLGSGVVDAKQDGEDIHPIYGHSVQDASEIPENLRPDHEVRLQVSPPDPQAGLPPAFNFDPTGLHVSSGDIVQFTFETPDHTVTSYHRALGFPQRVPDEAPPFSSPIVTVDGAWLYQFDREGVYDLYCGPHHVLGMVMRIVVGDLAEADYPDYVGTEDRKKQPPAFGEEFEGLLTRFSDENENVEWVFPSPLEVFGSDALDPGRIQEEGSVPASAVRDELAGMGGETTTE